MLRVLKPSSSVSFSLSLTNTRFLCVCDMLAVCICSCSAIAKWTSVCLPIKKPCSGASSRPPSRSAGFGVAIGRGRKVDFWVVFAASNDRADSKVVRIVEGQGGAGGGG